MTTSSFRMLSRQRFSVTPGSARGIGIRALPWLGLLVACSGDAAFEDEPATGNQAASALGGSASGGAAGRQSGAGGNSSVGSGGSANAAGGSSSRGAGAGGQQMSSEDGSGETGIFVGATAAHNEARLGLGIDPELPDLTWSEELAAFAQVWSDNLASRCGTIEHRVQKQYGENIALRGSSRLVVPFSAEEAVEGWVAEDACWDYGTIQGSERCDAQCIEAAHSNGCGHYTQVVWRNTARVGCGYSTCDNAEDGFTYEVWVCNYDPPGNYIGQTPY